MTRRLHQLARHATLVALAASLCLVALPGAAHARHDHDDSDTDYADSDRIDRRVYRPGRSRHRSHRRSQRRAYPVTFHGDTCRAHTSPIRTRFHRASYTCQPCGHRFHSRSRFQRHLHSRHRIPAWRLPHVIVHSSLGWIFHG